MVAPSAVVSQPAVGWGSITRTSEPRFPSSFTTPMVASRGGVTRTASSAARTPYRRLTFRRDHAAIAAAVLLKRSTIPEQRGGINKLEMLHNPQESKGFRTAQHRYNSADHLIGSEKFRQIRICFPGHATSVTYGCRANVHIHFRRGPRSVYESDDQQHSGEHSQSRG